jgi:hypothetical protein
MVSEDSTSRVIVLPVTVRLLVAGGVKNGGDARLTGLDKDLHDCGCTVRGGVDVLVAACAYVASWVFECGG